MAYPEEEVDRHVLTTPVFDHQPDDSTNEQLEYKQLEVYGDGEASPSIDASPIRRNAAEVLVRLHTDTKCTKFLIIPAFRNVIVSLVGN
jgi:hypothetical protein